MANGAIDEVRDRISEYLAARGGFSFDAGTRFAGRRFELWESELAQVFFVPHKNRVQVAGVNGVGASLSLPADAPDLLEQLGKTLDELGV